LAIRVTTFFLVGIVISLLAIFSINPKVPEIKNSLDFAYLEFYNYEIFVIDKENIKFILSGESGKRFLDRDEIVNLNILKNSGNGEIERISSKSVKIIGDLAIFAKSSYQNSKNLNILSSGFEYNLTNKIAISNMNFLITQNRSKITGDGFIYNTNSKELEANKIHALIEDNI